jgi:hypothetical protein
MLVMRQLIIGGSSKPTSGNNKRVDGDFTHVKTSNLYHVDVPKQFVGKKYSKLFDYFTSRCAMIPLGLYRTETVNLDNLHQSTE